MLSKHLFVIQKLSSIEFTSFGFAQKMLHDFLNTLLTHNQMTNFRLFHTERVCRQFQIWRKWQKVMSNFSFSHSVFKRLVSQGRQRVSLCGNGLTLSQTTNFKLFQTPRVCRQLFWIWWKWHEVLQVGRKPRRGITWHNDKNNDRHLKKSPNFR